MSKTLQQRFSALKSRNHFLEEVISRLVEADELTKEDFNKIYSESTLDGDSPLHDETELDENEVSTRTVKFMHFPNRAVSIGLHVTPSGDGYIALSAAAQREVFLAGDPDPDSNREDPYNKKHARNTICERISMHITNVRKQHPFKVVPIGKVFDKISMQKRIYSIFEGMLEDASNTILRKVFMMNALGTIKDILDGTIDETNSSAVWNRLSRSRNLLLTKAERNAVTQ